MPRKGCEDRQRAVVEALARAQQRDVQVGGAQALAQGQTGLQRGDAASGDDDARMVGGGCDRWRHRSAPAAPGPSVLACEMAAALPQSHRHPVTDGGGTGRTYGEGVFASVLVALSGHTEGRDALVLAAQLAGDDATIVVAHVMATSAAPLTGGTEAATRRRAELRDAGEDVYATLGPDPRVRYLPLSGLPFAEAVSALAHRERPDAIVVGQNLVSGEPGVARLLADAPCPVIVAPYGHRFVPGLRPGAHHRRVRTRRADRRRGRSVDGARRARRRRRPADRRRRRRAAEEWLAHAQELAPAAAATRVAGRGAGALVAQTRGDVDVLVIAGRRRRDPAPGRVPGAGGPGRRARCAAGRRAGPALSSPRA